MLEFLDRLRTKPEHYRKTVALVFVSVITGTIFLAWAVSSLARFSKVSIEDEVDGSTPISIESASAFSSLKDQFGAILKDGAEIMDSFRGPIEYNSFESKIEPN